MFCVCGCHPRDWALVRGCHPSGWGLAGGCHPSGWGLVGGRGGLDERGSRRQDRDRGLKSGV